MNRQMQQDSENITAQNQVNVGSGYRDVTYQGKQYRYNNRITAILYAGIDSAGAIPVSSRFTFAPRADSISLLVLDEYHRKMTLIALNRDTITEIHRFTVDGRDRGLFNDHLSMAFTYGEGGVYSCKNLCLAVSNLLYGVPVNEYVAVNRSALTYIADLLGSVTLTVPNDDLNDLGFLAGQTVSIDGSNLETFVRTRDIQEDFSNVGRMQRQRAYMEGAMERFRSLLNSSPGQAWNVVEEAQDYVLTNITRNRYLDLAQTVQKTAYAENSYYTPAGTQRVGADGYDEFYVDEEALLSKVIELFYLPL